MQNILILSVGRRVELVNAFETAMKSLDGDVFTADANPGLSAACQANGRYFHLPSVDHAEYIPTLLQLCLDNCIKLLIPTIDTELEILSKVSEEFKRDGVDIIVSNINFISMCRDKRLTSKFFRDKKVLTPKIYSVTNIKFPCFVKPYDGSLSKGIMLLNDETDLTDTIIENQKNIFCQFIDPRKHDEFTVDIYVDKCGSIKCVVPRKRLEVRGGEVSKAITEKNNICDIILDVFPRLEGVRGCINMQLFRCKSSGKLIFHEINPRFGGGYPLTDQAGANFCDWLVQEYFLEKNLDFFHDWNDGLLMLRYDRGIFTNEVI